MNSYTEVVIIVLMTFILPFAKADILPLDCGNLTGWQYDECVNLLNDTSLAQGQKEDLYLNLIESQGKLASYDFIWKWNKEIEFSKAPENAETQSSGIIKDAWVKIISASKSYFDLNKEEWFAEPSGEVLTAYNFKIELPSGTEAGDCKTNYSYQILNQNLKVELNDLEIGQQKISYYSTNFQNGEPMNFYAEFFVEAELRIDHFKENEWGCGYDSTEVRHYSVTAKDELNANAEVQETGTKIFLEKNPGMSRVIIETESNYPINDFKLEFGKNTYSFSMANFDLGFTADGILSAEKSLGFTEQNSGFLGLEFSGGKLELGTTETGECSYELVSDFEAFSSDCGLIELKETALKIETESDNYDVSEKIKAEVSLTDGSGNPLQSKKVILSAGNEQIELTTNEEGKENAEVPAYGILTAEFENDSEFKSAHAVKRIALNDSKSAGTAEGVAVFAGAYYFIFLIAKKLVVGL